MTAERKRRIFLLILGAVALLLLAPYFGVNILTSAPERLDADVKEVESPRAKAPATAIGELREKKTVKVRPPEQTEESLAEIEELLR